MKLLAQNGLDIHQEVHRLKEDRLLQLGRIIADNCFESCLQPIFQLASGTVWGHEALTRCPQSAIEKFKSVEALFRFAEDTDMVTALELLCWKSALKQANLEGSSMPLFLNCSPATLQDQAFNPSHLVKAVRHAGMRMDRIVVEITEGASIKVWDTFHRTVQMLRTSGCAIALDDVGAAAGYNSLSLITQIRPDYLKIDQAMIQGISTDRVKQAIVKGLLTISYCANTVLIAEGVEKSEDLAFLRECGVPYAQGWYLWGMDKPYSACTV